MGEGSKGVPGRSSGGLVVPGGGTVQSREDHPAEDWTDGRVGPANPGVDGILRALETTGASKEQDEKECPR